MSAHKILDRLDRTRQVGPGRWIARCPAHDDNSPSLSIRELQDGRVLLHDFGGCATDAVLAAIRLTMADLFAERIADSRAAIGFAPTRSTIPARDLLEVISEETAIVAIIATDLLEKKAISAENWKRLALAASRIHRGRDHLHGR